MDASFIFYGVDDLIHGPRRNSERLESGKEGLFSAWWDVPPFEQKMEEWTAAYPVVWNIGIGPAASFVHTLTRLLFLRTKDMYGPHDHVIHAKLSPTARGSHHSVTLEVFLAMASCLKIEDELQELKQLAEEEIYYGYGRVSEMLMLEAFGKDYITYFGSYSNLPVYLNPEYKNGRFFPKHGLISGSRYLLLVENLQVPILLDMLVFITQKWPTMFQNRWIISASSKEVYDKSREAVESPRQWASQYYITPDYYHALSFSDLRVQDWAMLITAALQDAANSIGGTLQQQQNLLLWLRLAQHCLYYGILYHPLHGAAAREANSKLASSSVSSDELVRCWVAEGLLSSATSPTNAPPGTGTEQRNNDYRSAYEAGKVVIQALQEYSLLPIYSVSTPTSSTCTSSHQDVLTGMSILATGVPRFKQDEFFDCEKSSRLRWVSFANDDARHVSWDWRDEENTNFRPGEITMSTLILRGCSDISVFPFDKVLNHHLRVLDLSYTLIDSLPPWFSLLLNLHLLSLRSCSKLKMLSPPLLNPSEDDGTSPLAHLGNLQVLDMNGVPLLELTQEDGSNKRNLHYLDLSGSRVITLPPEFFSEMSCLEELSLGNCSNLHKLPPSLAKLSNLLILCVEGTQITSFPEDTFEAMQRLHTLKLINNKRLMSLPTSLSKAQGLKELHIYNCIRIRLHSLLELVSCLEGLYIQTWQGLENIKIHGHPNLTTFSLSGPWIRCLSLNGCKKLKTVNFSDDTTALEAVDLSGTAIEEVPHNLPNLPQLRMLLLLNVPYFKRFPWHQLVRFPKMFCLSHCEDDNSRFSSMFVQQEICADENQHTEKTMNTAQININDSRMFHSFNADATDKLVKGGQFLQSFSVQVKPCSERGKEPRNKKVELCTNIQRLSPYLDVRSSEAASIMPMLKLQPRRRHVEISAIMDDRYSRGLRQLLSVTQSIFITDDASVRCLTDLNDSLMSLEECKLQQCHQMAIVLRMNSKGSEDALSSLKIVQVCNLENLLRFVEPSDVSQSKLITLKLLKHIHIENCPRLQKMFPCSLSLPSLESLVILFCTNLKTIFYKQSMYEVAPSPLPKIKRVYLQELPQLQHIHDDAMFAFQTPKWESLFVRGCRSFRRLPLLKKEYLKSKVKVSGERDWWDKLQLRLPEQSDYYFQVRQPEFASRKKSIIIRSYLR